MFMTDDQKKYYAAMKKMGNKKPVKATPRPKVSQTKNTSGRTLRSPINVHSCFIQFGLHEHVEGGTKIMVIFCDFLFHGTGPLISFHPVLHEKSSVVLLGTLQEGEVSE